MSYRLALFLITCLLAISWACTRSKSSTEPLGSKQQHQLIKGVIEGCSGEEIFLEEMGAREYTPVDTTICDASGAFEISFSTDHISFYVLRCGNSGNITLLMEAGESLELTGTSERLDNYQVQGSPGSELLRKLSAEHKQSLKALGELTRKNMDYASSPEYPAMKLEFDRQFDSITAKFKEYSI